MKLFDKFKKKSIFLYSEKEMEQFGEYVTKKFGRYSEVAHEIVSPDIHVDIIIVPPTEKCQYYKLITMGMGAYKMNIPRELKEYELERAELVLYLPPTWNIKSDKEEDYWIIRQLKVLARLPIQANTWLGEGHTVSSDENNTPYAENTKFCSMLLLNALDLEQKELNLRIESIGKINFYQVIPLYKEELEYKQNHGVEKLLNLFDNDMTAVVNNDRKNYGMDR